MSKDPVFPLWVFYSFLFQSVCLVPSPTNISVVCHNLVNVLYWNYDEPTEQLKFIVTVKPYAGTPHTIETFQTHLDISEYSSEAEDDYFVTVSAHDGQEESKSVSIKFSYNTDFVDANSPKCSVDFPLVITSVHKNVINVSFQHPYSIYKQDIMKEFTYKVSHDEREFECFAEEEEEELCTEEISLFQSIAGKCIDLKFEGTIDIQFTTAYKNVCLSEKPDASVDNLSYITALLGGGIVILSVVVGLVWLLCKKWSKIPKLPEVLINFMNPNKPTPILSSPVEQTFSSVSSMGHSPLLQTESSDFTRLTVSPPEKDTTIIPTDTEAEIVQETDAYERDVNFDDSGDYNKSSDYDSPKFLQEMSPGDFTTGYGPRPPIL